MKIFAKTFADGFMVKPDSVLLRNNDDFFFPPWAKELQAEAGVFFKIKKIGKNVSVKFAERYISDAGVAVMFYMSDADNYIERHQFDKSLAVSKMVEVESFFESKSSMKLIVARQDVVLPSFEKEHVYKCLSEATEKVTCKIGDILFMPLSEIGKVSVGDDVRFSVDGKNVLEFSVK